MRAYLNSLGILRPYGFCGTPDDGCWPTGIPWSGVAASISVAGTVPEFDGGLIDAGAMAVEVGRNAFERACAIEYGRAEPEPVSAWPHDRYIALVPLTSEECPGPRMADELGVGNHDDSPYAQAA